MLVLWAVAFIVLPELSFLIALIAVPIAVLAFGRAETPVLRSVHRIGDLSYGTYLWSYPVQQLVIERFDPLPLGVNLAVVVAIALLLAVLSWNLIEKPALTLKSGVPFAPWLRAPAPAG
jgi:peptidoglycan/LPS O-acetylase OafA/YrhL